jgi:hypothetical protein
MCPTCFWYRLTPYWREILTALFIVTVLAGLFVPAALATFR